MNRILMRDKTERKWNSKVATFGCGATTRHFTRGKFPAKKRDQFFLGPSCIQASPSLRKSTVLFAQHCDSLFLCLLMQTSQNMASHFRPGKKWYPDKSVSAHQNIKQSLISAENRKRNSGSWRKLGIAKVRLTKQTTTRWRMGKKTEEKVESGQDSDHRGRGCKAEVWSKVSQPPTPICPL